MKPKRIAMAHELILGYGIYKYMNVYVIFTFSLIFYRIIIKFKNLIFVSNFYRKNMNFFSS